MENRPLTSECTSENALRETDQKRCQMSSVSAFITEQFVVKENWEQPECLTSGERLDRVQLGVSVFGG